jgi:hypothetical protein
MPESRLLSVRKRQMSGIGGRVKRHLYKTKRGAVVTVPSDKVADLVDVKAHSIVVKDEVASSAKRRTHAQFV